MDLVTIILPSRNEPYLKHTVEDFLSKAEGDIEVIAILDGYWEDSENYVADPRVSYLHNSNPRGMREAINAGARMARGKYLLKADAHILMSQGYDTILKKHYQEKSVVVPRRYALDPEKWQIEVRSDNKYPLDYMFLSSDLRGEIWKERDRERKDIMVDDLMSSQGSLWFMSKDWFEYLDLMDEEKYGIFWNEFQEIGLKSWLYGGKCIINKYCFYAHWHKTKTRGYSLSPEDKEKARKAVEEWKGGITSKKQVRRLEWLVEKFKPVPTWDI